MQSYRYKYLPFLISLTLICSGCGTPLIRAVQQKDIRKAKSLLDEGADVNAQAYANGITALYGASIQGHKPMVKLLLARGANVNATTNEGETALSAAARYDHKEVFFVLMEAGAELNINDKHAEEAATSYLYTAEFYEMKGNDELAVEYYKKAQERCKTLSKDYTTRSLKAKSQTRYSNSGYFGSPRRLNLFGELMALDISKGNPTYHSMARDSFSRVPLYTQSSSASTTSTLEKFYAKKSSDWTKQAVKCKEKIAELSGTQ